VNPLLALCIRIARRRLLREGRQTADSYRQTTGSRPREPHHLPQFGQQFLK
jgi:hypothetical protein